MEFKHASSGYADLIQPTAVVCRAQYEVKTSCISLVYLIDRPGLRLPGDCPT